MRRAAVGSVFVVLASMLPSTGCDLGEPGEDLGTYDITLAMTQNSCGAQYGGFPSRVQFSSVLSSRSGVLRWKPENATEVSGTLTGTTGFRLSLESDQATIAPDRRYQYPGCVVRRSDVIEAVFTARTSTQTPSADGGSDSNTDGGVPPDGGWASTVTGFDGSESVVLGQVEGTDCRPMVGAGNGQVNALPCTVTYSLSARRR